MPDKNVQLPDGRIVAFPDSMADDDIAKVLQTQMGQQAPKSFMQKLGETAEATHYGAGEFANPDHPAHQMLSSALDDIKAGNYSKGAHGLFAAANEFLKPATPLALASPVSAAMGYGGGYVGSKAGQAIAEKAGATPEQATVAGDVGSLLGGAGASKAATLPSAVSKLAPRWYQSAMKPGPGTYSSEEVNRMVQTGLGEQIPVSQGGIQKINTLVSDLQDKVKAVIASNPNAPISTKAVASRLDPLEARLSQQVNPQADVGAVQASREEFLASHPEQIPAERAQAIKQGTYRALGDKSYGELKGATIESQKALARGIKEELATQFPEINQLNDRESKLIGLNEAVERAVRRIDNHQLIGIGTPIVAGGAGVLSKSTGMGMAAATIKAVIDDPFLKSKLAIAMNKAGKVPLNQANSRIAAYGAALRGASNAAPQQNPTNEQGAGP